MEKIDKEIVLLLINGSHSAFSKIYVKCHRQFFLLALRYLKSKEMAEDAVQYSFMRLWETRTQIDAEQGVEPYLYGILKNHLLNTYKAAYRGDTKSFNLVATPKTPYLPNENLRRVIQCRNSRATQYYRKHRKSILL